MKLARLGWAVGCGAVLAALSCGGKAKDPDIIIRNLPGVGDPPKRDASIPYEETDDSGFELIDAGSCCVLRFSLPVEADEDSATWVSPPTNFAAMTRDGGVWEASVCVPLEASTVYFYQTTVPPEVPDSGVFVKDRFDNDYPQMPGGSLRTVNVIDLTTVTGCSGVAAALDAGTAATDAGTDAGTVADAGTDAGMVTDAGTDGG